MPAPLIIGPDRIVTDAQSDVRNAFDNTLVDTLSVAREEHVNAAVATAHEPLP